ncbi:MAG: ABC transporter ATP-binding protein/permease [Lentisphaeria bacterium]|nr:ABC transporter ATP-binding protein/permease [Candidatus Neomarinimicrobiota bacterium]MCF7841971.1 ABC transporter ATP-binding protein/permease [Lentisphaeria bacterium]
MLRVVLKWFVGYWRRQWRGMLALFLLTTVGIALRSLYPYVFKYVIDSLTEGVDFTRVRTWILVILGLGIAREITQWLLPSTRYFLNLKFGQAIRLDHFDSILRKNHRFFNRFRSGDLITRLTDDIDGDLKLSWFSASGVMRPVEATLTLLFSIILMATLHWQLTLLAILPLPLIVWIMTKTEHWQARAYSERQKATSDTVDVLESVFAGIRIVIGYATEQAQTKIFHRTLGERKIKEERVVFVRSLLESLGSVINQVGLVIVLFAGGWLVIQKSISIGDFYAFVAYLTAITEPIWTISWFFVSSKLAETSVQRLKELKSGDNLVMGTREPEEIRDEETVLTFENVHFAFPGTGVPILEGVDLTLQPGEIVAVVGAVGSGKSTLLQLAGGLLTPDEGRIEFQQVPVHDLTPEVRARMIGFVPQEVILFSGSVAENITMGREHIEPVHMASASRTSVLENEVSPEKMVEQGGVGLSGGQRARTAIARALAGNPRMLLLDDVTAALDLTTERHFWQHLRSDYPEVAVLVTTHREATAYASRRVLWLEKGRIRAVGQHRELLKKFEEYRFLFAR